MLPISGTIQALIWRDWEDHKIVIFSAKIRTGLFTNASQQRYPSYPLAAWRDDRMKREMKYAVTSNNIVYGKEVWRTVTM